MTLARADVWNIAEYYARINTSEEIGVTQLLAPCTLYVNYLVICTHWRIIIYYTEATDTTFFIMPEKHTVLERIFLQLFSLEQHGGGVT